MHAPYHPWVEALPVGGLYVARFLTPDSVFRIRGRMVAAAAECCSRPFGGSCASGSDVIRGDPACMADHGEAVRVQRRRRRHAHRDRARPKVVRCASPQKSVTDLQASSCYRVITNTKPIILSYLISTCILTGRARSSKYDIHVPQQECSVPSVNRVLVLRLRGQEPAAF